MKSKKVSLNVQFVLKFKKNEKFQNFKHDLRQLKDQIKWTAQNQGFYVTYEDPKTGQSYDGDVVPCSIIIRETPFLINSGKD